MRLLRRVFGPHAGPAFIFLGLWLVAGTANAQSTSFAAHAQIWGRGKILNSIVAPGPTPGSEWIYASYINIGGAFDIVAVNPDTNQFQVFKSPLITESGAWAMAEGPDNAVYIGTLPSAHIMRVDWKSRRLVDLGTPSPGESYIWALTLGSDGKLYGVTSPHAKLISFDPRTERARDLGRMSTTNDYARFVEADERGFVYVGTGVGSSRLGLVAYDIATGQHRDILPANKPSPSGITLARATDGAVYAKIAGDWFRLSGWKALSSSTPGLTTEHIRNGVQISFEGSRLLGRGTDGKIIEYASAYGGAPQEIFNLAAGPDGRVYGSTSMPLHLFRADAQGTASSELGELGQGEAYSLLAWDHRLIGAMYAGIAPIFIYDPSRPWQPGPKANENPWLIHFAGADDTWRPMAMVASPQGKIFIAGLPGYGVLGGSMYVLDPERGTVTQYGSLFKDQSIVTLAMLPDGLLVGGTSIYGGSDTHPTQRDAILFLWNAERREKILTDPIRGEGTIDALGISKSGLVYGFAGTSMFVFDPARKIITPSMPSGIGKVLPNAVGLGPDGALYGLTHQGIFRISDHSRHPALVASYSPGIDRGFAIVGGRLFFASKSRLLSYQIAGY